MQDLRSITAEDSSFSCKPVNEGVLSLHVIRSKQENTPSKSLCLIKQANCSIKEYSEYLLAFFSCLLIESIHHVLYLNFDIVGYSV